MPAPPALAKLLVQNSAERERAPVLTHLVDKHAATIGRVVKLADDLRREADDADESHLDEQPGAMVHRARYELKRRIVGRIRGALDDQPASPPPEGDAACGESCPEHCPNAVARRLAAAPTRGC